MEKYLHCIDLSDKLKCFNLCSTTTISSLLIAQLFISDAKPYPFYMDMEKLKDCTAAEIDGLSSARMFYVFQRSILNKYTRELTNQEKIFVHLGNLEIAFEEARRHFNYAAPSRLSTLYLVEDSHDGRAVLGSMFSGSEKFKNPMVIEVSIFNKLEMKSFDSNWIGLYYKNPKEEYLEKYWMGVMYNDRLPSWEYLLEGTIQMCNNEQIKEIDDYVKTNFPEDYKAIKNAM